MKIANRKLRINMVSGGDEGINAIHRCTAK